MVDPSLREFLSERAGFCCEYCQMPVQYDPLPFQVDHIIARKHRGQTVEDSLSLSCFACNIHKGPSIAGVDPNTGEIVSLFKAGKDVLIGWSDFIVWSERNQNPVIKESLTSDSAVTQKTKGKYSVNPWQIVPPVGIWRPFAEE